MNDMCAAVVVVVVEGDGEDRGRRGGLYHDSSFRMFKLSRSNNDPPRISRRTVPPGMTSKSP